MGQITKKKTSNRIKNKKATKQIKKNRKKQTIKRVLKPKNRRRSKHVSLRKPTLLSAKNLPRLLAYRFSSPRNSEQKKIWNRILQVMPSGYSFPDISIVQPLMNERIHQVSINN